MSKSPLASTARQIIETVEANAPRENEYIGEDGLLRCSVCGGPRQVVVSFLDQTRVVRCVCSCADADRQRREAWARYDEIARKRRLCFEDTDMAQWNFENDDRRRVDLSDAAGRYAEQFNSMRKHGKGLLYYGPVGTGKTYLAACIANAVIDNGYSARMTNFTDISDKLQSTWEKDAYIDELRRFDLLIIDDLGAERKSEYMQEIVYKVIDARYRAGGPMIITTNLTDKELSQTGEIGYSRIYDRIMERCLAVKVDGQSRRRQAVKQNWNEMRQQLGMEV